MVDTSFSIKMNAHRRLCIKKDLIELCQWIDMLTNINIEIDHLSIIEKQLLHNASLTTHLRALRRKNTLSTGSFCKYEQELKKELEYGTREYDLIRAKEHEKKRACYLQMMEEFHALKLYVYQHLSKFQRRSRLK